MNRVRIANRFIRCPFLKECRLCDCTFEERIKKSQYIPFTSDEHFLLQHGFLNYRYQYHLPDPPDKSKSKLKQD